MDGIIVDWWNGQWFQLWFLVTLKPMLWLAGKPLKPCTCKMYTLTDSIIVDWWLVVTPVEVSWSPSASIIMSTRAFSSSVCVASGSTLEAVRVRLYIYTCLIVYRRKWESSIGICHLLPSVFHMEHSGCPLIIIMVEEDVVERVN